MSWRREKWKGCPHKRQMDDPRWRSKAYIASPYSE
jgi:hypothetical protein